ncbi:MAG TPA: ATP-binding protein [Oligoflexus sp.]|uniref:ATP-binding protein n=1 Tax=Oligoflexus sp. TaxID=1971216 RepID=UPI002D803E91|nr:ATP-binding protein [Oligoflexus sp.]HET9235896.1 ATP-binding protein [Oligoflexus sp.]
MKNDPTDRTVDLTNCDQEPIHIPGSIQPHGVLVGIKESSRVIELVSNNIFDFFGYSAESILQKDISILFDEPSLKNIFDCLGSVSDPRLCGPLEVKHQNAGQSRLMQGILHRSSGLLIIELEDHGSSANGIFDNYHLRLRQTISGMREMDRVDEMCHRAAQEVKHLTGFDRVMLYRFDSDWNGQVVAEAREAHLEPFLGLHYPASDIPEQARRLYTINRLRLIADRDYTPAPLIAHSQSKLHEPIDLSHSVLRSVSPIHLQYLRNMGVEASMSVSLVQEGKLWGLIACHHYAPKHVSYDVRLACESLAQILSWQIASRERSDHNSPRAAAAQFMSDILTSAAAASSLIEGLLQRSADLLQLVQAQGVAIKYRNQIATAGVTPSKTDITELVAWLQAQDKKDVYVTHKLSRDFPEAARFAHTASGIIVIHLHSGHDDCIIWFRPELVSIVNWAGNPGKIQDPETNRLTPRGSFALWQETVNGQSQHWLDWQVEAATRFLYLLVASIVRKAEEIENLNRELQYANQAKDEFLAMVSHELRTPLNSMIGWMQMIRGGLLHESEYEDAYQTIERNAYDQLQLIEDLIDISRIVSGKMQIHAEVIDVNRVLQNAISSVKPALQSKGIQLINNLKQPVMVYADPDRLQQVFWNLLNNAVKFTPKQGRIDLEFAQEDSNVRISIQDSGQGIEPDLLPFIFDRFRQGDNSMARKHLGLGLGLAICRHLIELHGGRIRAHSTGKNQGARFEIELPIAPLDMAVQGLRETPSDFFRLECPPVLQNKRILIVDDEPASRKVLALVFTRLGLTVELAESGEAALQILIGKTFDFIVSDIGMPTMDGFQFAEALRARGRTGGGAIPAIALSAYTRGQDKTRAFRSGFQAHVAKPVDIKELLEVMEKLCESGT